MDTNDNYYCNPYNDLTKTFMAAGRSFHSSLSDRNLAITPAAWGAAMEVPEKAAVPLLGVVEMIFEP